LRLERNDSRRRTRIQLFAGAHGRLREKPALDDVFGIKRENLEVRRGRAKVVVELGKTQFETVFREPVVAANDIGEETYRCHGYHDDGSQAFFEHPYGSGKAVYLNADLYSYMDMRRRGQERRVRELFAKLLVSVNHLFPPFPVKRQYGSAAGRMEVTRLRDGNTWYYGVLPAFDVDDKAPRPVILPFPEGRHVYDVRAHKYLGPGGPIEDTLYPGRPAMYAALPYPVDGLTVRAPREVRRGEPVEIPIVVAARTDDMGPHAVRVEVSLPGGRQAEYLARTLYLSAGEGTFSFVPALNSPKGRWHVSAVEAVSGTDASAHFDVR